MGHTIRAYSTEGVLIDELGFASHNYVLANYAYGCLHAKKYNYGVGGNGQRVFYSAQQIRKSHAALEYYREEPYEEIADPDNEILAETILTVFLGDAQRSPVDQEKVRNAIERLQRFLEKLVIDSGVIIEFG